MKKALVILGGILLLSLVGRWIYVHSVSDATRIRWLLEDMAAGFNASSSRAAVSGLSDDFADRETGVSKPELRAFLLQLFLRERDPQSKEFNYRVELGEPRIRIEEPERKGAAVNVRAEFFRRRGKAWRSDWEVDIDADLRREDAGWRIQNARRRTLSGKRPF